MTTVVDLDITENPDSNPNLTEGGDLYSYTINQDGFDFSFDLVISENYGTQNNVGLDDGPAIALGDGGETVLFKVENIVNNGSSEVISLSEWVGFTAQKKNTFGGNSEGNWSLDGGAATSYVINNGSVLTSVPIESSGEELSLVRISRFHYLEGMQLEFESSPVPEPGSLSLLGLAVLGTLSGRRRKV